MKRQHKPDHLISNRHLTDEAVAICVEAMMNQRFPDKIPDAVKSHLLDCTHCNERVAGLFQDIKDEPEIIQLIVEKHQSVKKSSISIIKISRYAAAAILLILISAGSYFLLRPASPEQLFERHFEIYPNLNTVKSSEANELSRALLYYEVKDWDTAILLLNDFLLVDKSNVAGMFYLANAYLAEGESEQAIFWLKKAAAEHSNFKDQINWYLALAYLHQKDIKQARSQLEMLVGKSNFYSEKARKLLRKLR